eukprot:342501-Amphidinium_carterae.1
MSDIQSAFLNTPIQPRTTILVKPPPECEQDNNILWKLNKQHYELRDSPQKFQLHLPAILKQLGLQQLRSDQCVYHNDDITVMVYVDDLLLINDDDKIKTILQKLESQLQLKHVKKLQRDQPLVLLGRQIEYYGDHIVLSMTKDYYTSLLSLYNIKENTNSLSTTGTKRPPITTGELLDSEEDSTPRTIVGKLLWMCPLRPDIQYTTKELTRAVQKPEQHHKRNPLNVNIYSNTYKEQGTTTRTTRTTTTTPPTAMNNNNSNNNNNTNTNNNHHNNNNLIPGV